MKIYGKKCALFLTMAMVYTGHLSAAELLVDHFKGLVPGRWMIEGRGTHGVADGVLHLTGCEAAAGEISWNDYELSFRARAPEDAAQAQIWASVRRTARDSRYVIGVRGGNNNEIYIARYAPNGRQAFLGVQELASPPRPGEWRQVRIVVTGQNLRVYLDQASEPVMEVTDKNEGWLGEGGISLGGGYLPTEYDDVVVRRVVATDAYGFAPNAIQINLQPEAMESLAGWVKATGAVFTESAGQGWTKDMKSFERKRNRLSDPMRDSVVSVAGGIRENEFRYALPNGDYVVTMWVGDPSFATSGDVCFQGEMKLSSRVSLTAGHFESVINGVRVTDGFLRVKITRSSDQGFSVQALIIEPRSAEDPQRWDRVVASAAQDEEHGGKIEALRQAQRAAYQPVKIKVSDEPRSEIPLDGKWLFLPDYEFKRGVDYPAPALDDKGWHVMDVPAFWTTADNWLYDGVQGGSDRWNQLERARLGQYTFDWQRTKAAWYRHGFELESVPVGTRFELCFDAIAKISEIYVNGHHVASNVGMFRSSQTDITSWVHPGGNSIAVRVGASDTAEDNAENDKVAAVAVTVAVTERMLRTLPHGIYCGQPGGIWQPVKLVAHRDVHVKDLFFQPRLDGAKIELAFDNLSGTVRDVVPEIAFTSKQTGLVMTPQAAFAPITLKTGEVVSVTLDTGRLAPELWSPATPNLYTLRVALRSGGQLLDERQLDVGFRTFEARKDGRLYLNGKPYWLRGGSHTPMPTRPWDTALAEGFTKLMHDGNVRVTRSVCAPWNELWLSCADRNGVGVSQEGTWPWLMIDGKLPAPQLLDYWRQEHLALIRKYRNHPSILFWTVNNESYYVKHKDPQILERTMTVLSDTIKEMRALDPTRPICPDSGGVLSMAPPFYEKMAKENGFDYGDIDDKHDYTSWYVKSFFQQYPMQAFMDGHTGEILPDQLRQWVTPGRPLISQEMATGYPNGDDGHAVRKYIFDHMVPQVWVGDYSYEHNDPQYLLGSVAFNTKELAETLRCYYRDTMAGVLHFALNCWYQNLFEADRIRPYPPAKSLAKALQPVLVSARLYGRHFYAGARPQVNLFVVNDDEQGRDLGPTRLVWALQYQGKELARGEQALPAVPYYQNHAATLSLHVPDTLPQPRVDVKLVLQLIEGNTLVSRNDYDLVLAEKGWVCATATVPRVMDADRRSEPLWNVLGIKPQWTDTIPQAVDRQWLVVHDYDWTGDKAKREQFLGYVAAGGRVLLNSPGGNLTTLFPDMVKSFRGRDGEIAGMRVPESPVFAGIEVMDMRWFDRGDKTTPIALNGDFLLSETPQIEVLAKYVPSHAYLNTQKQKDEMEGAVLFSLSHGAGRVWVTQLAHETGVHDPIAARILRNMMEME